MPSLPDSSTEATSSTTTTEIAWHDDFEMENEIEMGSNDSTAPTSSLSNGNTQESNGTPSTSSNTSDADAVTIDVCDVIQSNDKDYDESTTIIVAVVEGALCYVIIHSCTNAYHV